MKTITQEINICSFSELPENIKSIVYGNWIDNLEFDYDSTFEYYKDFLLKAGFNNNVISFSGFSSQGDGSSFVSNHINILLFIKNKPEYTLLKWGIGRELLAFDCTVYRHNFHYSHENTTAISMDYNIYEYEKEITNNLRKFIESKIDQLESDLESYRLTLSKNIYDDLQKEYDYQTDHDHIKELIEINEYQFLENGDIYNG